MDMIKKVRRLWGFWPYYDIWYQHVLCR